MLTKLGERGFVRLDRELTEYPQIYCNPVVFTVYGHCLLNAAYREKYYAGILLQPGQFITSYAAMAKECGITEKQARSAFERLEESHLIERKPVGNGRKSGTLVTVANSQFIAIGKNEVGLKTSEGGLRTVLEQGNYLINNKKNEEEKEHKRDQIEDLICGVLDVMNASGFSQLPTEHDPEKAIRDILQHGHSVEEIAEEILHVVKRSQDTEKPRIKDAVEYLCKRFAHADNGWSFAEAEAIND